MPMHVPPWGKGVPINTDQAANSGRFWPSRRESCKKPQHNTNTRTCEILVDSVPCDGWCWGLFAAWRKLMCPYEYTNKPHRCNFQYSSPGSAKKTIFSTSTVSLLAEEGIADICLESDPGGQRDSRRARVSYGKHAAAFKPQLAKAKPCLGEGAKQWVSCSRYCSCPDTKDTLILHLRAGKK